VFLANGRYVYQLRDLVRQYGTEEEIGNTLPELERTEDWLYNEGSATDNPGARNEDYSAAVQPCSSHGSNRR
jgi:hypothetical protein